VVLATHAALPEGAVHRCHVLRNGRLHDMSSHAAILA
jgi:ATP-binding cassette subfamily C protein CydC